MARVLSRQLQKYIYGLLALSLSVVSGGFAAQINDDFAPEFHSIKQTAITENVDYKKIVFEVRGRNIKSGIAIKATASNTTDRNRECSEDLKFHYNFNELQTHEFQWAQYELTVPRDARGEIYLCLPRRVRNNHGFVTPIFSGDFFTWFSQGPDVKLNLNTE